LIGEIIRRFEQRDLKIVALEMFQPTHDQIDNHYPKDEAWIRRVGQKTLGTYEKYGMDPKAQLGTADDLEIGTMVRKWLIEFMISAPLVHMAVEDMLIMITGVHN
jgi:nucleoside-diphosphate kinase